MSSIEVIQGYMKSDDFVKKYTDYLITKDNNLSVFLDNIDLNKKYYRMNLIKNKKYAKVCRKEKVCKSMPRYGKVMVQAAAQ